jgi:hypothetical protein
MVTLFSPPTAAKSSNAAIIGGAVGGGVGLAVLGNLW